MERDEFVVEVQATLRMWAARGMSLHPFEHGTFFDQLSYEVNSVRVEMGDEIATLRRRKSSVSSKVRAKVFKRDNYTCVSCGWMQPRPNDARRTGRFLTLDHIIPRSEGGSNFQENLVTKCSRCNNEKGKRLPDESEV